MADYDFEEKKPSGEKEYTHEALDGKGFVSDSSCEDEYERHENHAYDRDDGSADHSHAEKDDRFSSGTSGGTFYRRYPGGSYNRGSEGASYSRDGSASGRDSSPDAMVSPKTDGLGIASMVCGITSLFFCCLPFMGLVVAIVGLVLGIVSQKKKPNGFALAGIITSAFGIAFGMIMTIGLICGLLEGINDHLPSFSSDPDSSFDPNNVAKAIITRLFRG